MAFLSLIVKSRQPLKSNHQIPTASFPSRDGQEVGSIVYIMRKPFSRCYCQRPRWRNLPNILLFLLITIFAACSYSDEWQEVKTAEEYSISLPPYLEKPENQLNPQAKLQYCNYFRNVYVVVVDTPKSKFDLSLQDYYQKEYDLLLDRLTKPQHIDSTRLTVGGLPARQFSMTGEVGKYDVVEKMYYRITIVESEDKYYLISIWMWDEWRRKYRETVDQIVQSFKLL